MNNGLIKYVKNTLSTARKAVIISNCLLINYYFFKTIREMMYKLMFTLILTTSKGRTRIFVITLSTSNRMEEKFENPSSLQNDRVIPKMGVRKLNSIVARSAFQRL